MEKINVKKEELLKILKENLDLHEKIYLEIIEKFKFKYIIKLTEMIEEAKTIEKFDTFVNLSVPHKNSQDYKDAIRMVELEVNNIIVLSHKEFCAYVLNKWDWICNFENIYISNLSITGYSGISGYSGYSGYSPEANKYFKK